MSRRAHRARGFTARLVGDVPPGDPSNGSRPERAMRTSARGSPSRGAGGSSMQSSSYLHGSPRGARRSVAPPVLAPAPNNETPSPSPIAHRVASRRIALINAYLFPTDRSRAVRDTRRARRVRRPCTLTEA
ncbi:MAG: hypothetical protein IT379_37810 [Deltaproteobacteria bacterium]|nr:hypothetical protein [Deltaproteobacteria bacterium]